jgi:hypothetical protein
MFSCFKSKKKKIKNLKAKRFELIFIDICRTIFSLFLHNFGSQNAQQITTNFKLYRLYHL